MATEGGEGGGSSGQGPFGQGPFGQGPFGQGPFGGIGGLGELLKQATRIKERIAEIQSELANKRVEGTAGGGMVTAVANGRGELVSLRIDPEVVDRSDIEMLQDLIIAAVNQATRNSREAVQEEMAKLTGGIRIPGLF